MIRAFQATRMLGRMLYSQQEKPKNVFVMPNINHMPSQMNNEMRQFIQSSRSCKILAVLLRDNINLCSQFHLEMIFLQLRTLDLSIDDSMYSTIIPITLEYINLFTRENSLTLNEILMTVLHNGIESEIFWEAIMKKMDGENIYRYLPLNETALLLNALLQHPVYQNHSLTKKLIQVVYQQKKYYLAFPDTRNIIREILFRLDQLKSSEPQLTEAFKEIV